MSDSGTPARHIQAVSIPELHKHLVATYKQPPSLITLKRWAAAGELKGASRVVFSAGKNSSAGGQGYSESSPQTKRLTKYFIDKAVEIIAQRWNLDGDSSPIDLTQSPIEPDTQAAADGGQPDQPVAKLMELVHKLSNQVEANTRAIEAIGNQVNQQLAQLNGVRTTLMMKYDTVSAQQSQIISDLRQRIGDQEGAAALAREVQSIKISLSRVLDEIRSGRQA